MAKITVFGQPVKSPTACACPAPTTRAGEAGSAPMETAQKIAAGGIQSMTHGTRSLQQVDISKLIELEKFQNQQAAAANPAAGIDFIHFQGGSPRE